MNRSKRSALRAESRDPIAARTMLPIPPRDLRWVRRLVSLRAGFERLHLQGSKARRLQRAFRLRPGCGACCPAEPGPEGHADARRRCGKTLRHNSRHTPSRRAFPQRRLASAAASAAPSNPLLSESSFESSSLGAFQFGSLSSNHALSTSTSGDLDSRNCQTL